MITVFHLNLYFILTVTVLDRFVKIYVSNNHRFTIFAIFKSFQEETICISYLFFLRKRKKDFDCLQIKEKRQI